MIRNLSIRQLCVPFKIRLGLMFSLSTILEYDSACKKTQEMMHASLSIIHPPLLESYEIKRETERKGRRGVLKQRLIP